MARVEFRILGPLQAWDEGRELELGPGRQRALLALLLLRAGETVSAERLVDELWGERPPASAPKIVQNYVSQLRRVLPAETILTGDSGYLVRAGLTDADEFERLVGKARGQDARAAAATLRVALALWRGRALADVAYDAWAQVEITRLEELRLTALEDRIDADLSVGRAVELVPELEALALEHPLRERLVEQLMLALYRSGRQADALAVYSAARKRFLDELGIEPGPELQDLQRKILAHDSELGPTTTRRALAAVSRRARWLVVAGIVLIAVAAAGLWLTWGSAPSRVAVTANSLALLNPATGRLTADIPVGTRPVSVAVGEGAVWVANADDGTVSRIDPKTRRVVDTIGIGADVSALAVGFGSVWVADGNDGTVTEIDPSSNAIQATLSLGQADPLASDPVFFLASDRRFMWATRGSRLLRIDPETGTVKSVDIGTPVGLATGGDAVWVTTLGERLLRVQPETLAVSDSTALPSQGISPVFSGGSLWLSFGRGVIVRVDSVTLAPTATALVGGSPTNLAVGPGAIWVSNSDGNVSKIDPRNAQVAAAGQLGQALTALAVADGAVWVTAGPSGR